MVIQARAHASRQIILAAAAELIEEYGFSATTVADIITHAGVSKGRFAYHFPSKEALAAALIEEADTAIADIVAQTVNSASSALEGLIRASFAVADLMANEQIVRVGQPLGHGLGKNISPSATVGMAARLKVTAEAVTKAITQGDVCADLDPEQVGYAIIVSLRGNMLQSTATGSNPGIGLALLWPILLRGLVTDQSAEFHEQVVIRLARQHTGS